MKDKLIPYYHSQDLHDKCGGPCSLLLPTRMDHNDFDFCEDLVTPYFHFLKQVGINTKEPKSAHLQMRIPEEYFVIPKAYQQLSIQMSWGCCCNPTNNIAGRQIIVTNSQMSEGNYRQVDGEGSEIVIDRLVDDEPSDSDHPGNYVSLHLRKKQSSSSKLKNYNSPSNAKISWIHGSAAVN